MKGGTDKLAPGLDVKTGRAYIVGAGSTIDGKRYAIDDTPIAPAPAWVIERCTKAHDRAPAADAPAIVAPSAEARAIHYLQHDAPLAIEGQGGDATTFKVAAQVKDFGATEGRCFALMAQHWNERCTPPWDQLPLMAKVQHAFRYGDNPAGCAAPEADFEPVPIEAQPAALPAAPARFRAKGLAEFRVISARDALIDGLIEPGKLAMLLGPSGAGKSWIALHIGLSIASGRPWFDRATRAGLVVYIAAEGATTTERRAAIAMKHLGIGGEVPFRIIDEPPAFVANSHDAEALADVIKDAEKESGHKAALIVVDTLSAAMPGADENGPRDMGFAVSQLQRLARLTGATVLVIHHTGKDETKGSRGHTSLLAALDTQMIVREKQKDIYVKKQRDFVDHYGIGFTFHKVSAKVQGETHTALIPVTASPSATQEFGAVEKEQSAIGGIFDSVRESPGRYSQTGFCKRFAGKFGIGRPALVALMRKMLADGHLILRMPTDAEIEVYGLLQGRISLALDIGLVPLPADQYVAPEGARA